MNDLFDSNIDNNLLPYDGEVIDHGLIMAGGIAKSYYEKLLNVIDWKSDEALIFGKRILTKRKVAWYGDQNYSYTYSNATKTALPWNETLIALKKMTEQATGATYNSCLLNLYHDGSEGMAWHSDGEKMLGENMSIGSLSLGATRKFAFKHKLSKLKIDMILQPGSLIEMKGITQKHWLHRLPPTKLVKTPRINLTFRTIAT